MQIATSVHQVYVSYVTDPQPIGSSRNVSLYLVLVLVIAMVRVGRMPWLGLGKRKPEIVHDVQEGITSRNPVALEHTLEHQPQLVVAYAGIHLTDLLHGIDNARQTSNILGIIAFLLIIRLF